MIYAFNSPMVGPGQLLPREDAHAGTDKERFLFEPNSSDKFWKPLAAQLAATGTSVYLNLAQRCDLATLGQIVTMTGGTTRLYPQFTPEKDSVVMETDLASSLDRVFGYDALMRIRCSNGLRVGKYYGNFIINEHDVELAGLDSRTTLSASIAYDGALDEKYDSSFQLAMLYTTATGSRRIRVLTYAVPASSVIGNVFRGGDIDATVNHVLRVSADQVSQVGNKTYRDHLADVCVKLLASYRKNCASGTAAGQLILPEAYKLLPLYSLSMSRLRPFRSDYGIDARVALLERLKSAPVYETLAMVYPRMWCVSELVDGEWILDEVRASIERLDHSKAYLMENGRFLMLWVGRGVDPGYIHAIFGVPMDQVNVNAKQLPALDNATSQTLRNYISHLGKRFNTKYWLQVVRQGMDPFMEVEFASYLVEDKSMVQPSVSYVDFLIDVHRRIQTES